MNREAPRHAMLPRWPAERVVIRAYRSPDSRIRGQAPDRTPRTLMRTETVARSPLASVGVVDRGNREVRFAAQFTFYTFVTLGS